ncbi:hypothetical protein N9M66_00420 [Litoreibacter sp.]|nr:hypothetical protein [Litoreibacter sp.]
MFRYPLSVWADDAALQVSKLEDCISELINVGLIEFDEDEQVVRIVAWFHKKNCPENASRMISLVGDYYASDDSDAGMFCRSVSEFIVGSIRRAQGWKSDSPDWPKLRECFTPFLRQSYQDYGDLFLNSLAAEVLAAGKAVRAEICSLFPLCSDAIALLETPPSGHPVDTLRPHDTTRHDTNTRLTKHLDETNTAQNSGEISKLKVQSQIANVEVLRTGDPQTKGSTQSRPLEGTKRSKLAMEAMEARKGANG